MAESDPTPRTSTTRGTGSGGVAPTTPTTPTVPILTSGCDLGKNCSRRVKFIATTYGTTIRICEVHRPDLETMYPGNTFEVSDV